MWQQAARIAAASPLPRAGEFVHRNDVAVIAYHYVEDQSAFVRQLRVIEERNTFISPDELQLPNRCCVAAEPRPGDPRRRPSIRARAGRRAARRRRRPTVAVRVRWPGRHRRAVLVERGNSAMFFQAPLRSVSSLLDPKFFGRGLAVTGPQPLPDQTNESSISGTLLDGSSISNRIVCYDSAGSHGDSIAPCSGVELVNQ